MRASAEHLAHPMSLAFVTARRNQRANSSKRIIPNSPKSCDSYSSNDSLSGASHCGGTSHTAARRRRRSLAMNQRNSEQEHVTYSDVPLANPHAARQYSDDPRRHDAILADEADEADGASLNQRASTGPLRTLDEFLDSCVTNRSAATSQRYTALAATALPIHCNAQTEDYNMDPPPIRDSASYPWRYWLIFMSLGIANSSDAAEILCLSYILSVDNFQRHMLHDTAWRASLLAATVFAGMLLGGLMVGCGGDTWGRRPMLIAGLAVNAVAGVGSALAWNVYVLSLCRLVAGLGVGATVPPLFALASELAPPLTRGFWVTLVASFWMVGSVYVAVMGWFILEYWSHGGDADTSLSWRLFAAAAAVPSCVGCLLVRHCVPESPRFLLLQGQYDHALVVIHQLAESLHSTHPPMTRDELVAAYPVRTNDVADCTMEARMETEPVETESFQRMDCRPETRGWTSLVGAALREFGQSASQLYTTPSLRSTIWPLQLVWFSLSFGSYGLLTWINTLFEQVHLENVYFNALLFAASNLPGNILSAYLMDKIGRARLLTGSILAAALSLIAFAYVANAQQGYTPSTATNEASHISVQWVVVSACLFQCFTTSAWNAIDVVTSELFPTSLRSTGMGVCAATGRVGAMLAQLVNGLLVSHPVRLLMTAALTLLLGSLTPSWLPDDQTGQAVADYAVDTRDANKTATSYTDSRTNVRHESATKRHSPRSAPHEVV